MRIYLELFENSVKLFNFVHAMVSEFIAHL